MHKATNFWSAMMAVTLALVIGPASGALAQGNGAARGKSATAAQKKKKAAPKRAPTRVIVRRAYPYNLDHSIYPRPDDVSWPGPNAVRECAARLVPEHRPSGTVIVPRMRCWWQPK